MICFRSFASIINSSFVNTATYVTMQSNDVIKGLVLAI